MPLEFLGEVTESWNPPPRPNRPRGHGEHGTAQGVKSLIPTGVPTNVRTFVKNLMRDDSDTGSLLSAEDFTPAEIEEIYRQIETQNAKNTEHEAYSKTRFAKLQEKARKEATPEVQARLREWAEEWGAKPGGNGIQDLRSNLYTPDELVERHNRKTQRALDNVQTAIQSYGKDRNKTSVRGYEYEGLRHEYKGPGFLKTIIRSFTSPAYNISTTLGQYNAFKNEDGTVTIKDNYDWAGKGEKRADMSLGEFVKALPKLITHPELLGNVIMRSAFKDKGSPIEFDLPPRDSVEMPKEYKHGGRARLI